MIEKIYLYYTNDLHSNFTYWPQVVNFLKQSKIKRKQRNEAHFIVDIGDHIDRVHPIAEAFMGKGNVRLLNEANYDVVTLGNNEGITLAHHELFQLYDEADFDVVCSNLHSLTEEEPAWLKRTVFKQTDSQLKIAFIGLTAAFNPFYNLLNWHVDDPMDTITKQINAVKEQANIIILLSHLGYHRDQEIAESFPEIDAIIGGHTHHLLQEGELIGNAVVTAAGKYCNHVGEVILTYDHQEKKLVNKEAYVTNISYGKKDSPTVALLEELSRDAERKLSTTITNTNNPFLVDWYKETKILKDLTLTLMEWTKADLAMLNAGILLESLPAGTITYKDIHRICPHPINPVVVEVTGKELKEIVRVGQTKEFMNIELKGFGFRGKKLGKLIFSGLSYKKKNLNNSFYIKDLRINGDPLEDDRTYSLATADMFIFGRLLPEVAKSKQKNLFLPEFIRDLLAYSLRKL